MVVLATRLTKKVQWPILNNSHTYPFCKTTPGTQLAIAPFFVSETRSKRSQNYSVSESQGAPKPIANFKGVRAQNHYFILYLMVLCCLV